MTYPPPPGPGGWGTPPQGPYGPPGGQFPPTGPPPGMPQQPYPPPPPPGPYPPRGPMPAYYGVPQGSPPGPPWGAPPKRSPLPWILGGGAGLVLVIVIAVVLVVVFGGSSPQAVAQQAVADMNSQNTQDLTTLVCAQDQAAARQATQGLQQLEEQLPDIPDSIRNIKPHYTLGQVIKDSDSQATTTITQTWTNVPPDLPSELRDVFTRPLDIQAQLIKEDGDWKLCNLNARNQFGG